MPPPAFHLPCVAGTTKWRAMNDRDTKKNLLLEGLQLNAIAVRLDRLKTGNWSDLARNAELEFCIARVEEAEALVDGMLDAIELREPQPH
jgi:hypothetical protein